MDKVESEKWRLHAKQFFLTWPTCELTKEKVIEILQEKLPIEQYIIAKEFHKNGTPHIHAYIKCTKVVDIRNPKKLDLEQFHGNYQTCRSSNAVIKYCQKEEDYITNIPNFQPIAAAIRVIKADNFDEKMDIVINSPDLARDYLRDTAKYEKSLARLHQSPVYQNLTYRFKTMASVIKWKRTKHALWLKGPTGLGKTEFAKSQFKNPLLVSHIDKLKDFSPKIHDGIIFDDMCFTHWPREAQIHILDLNNDRDINVKYGMVTIPMRTPRIFTSNVPIFIADPAIQRRLRLIKIVEDLRLLEEDLEKTLSDASSNSLNPSLEDLKILSEY